MLKTIIIGAGAIAHAHARALRTLGVDIAGVYDVRTESAETLAGQYGTRVVRSMPAYESLLGEADMIHLCTPPSKRIDYAEPAMRAGCHVVTEKPLAATMADAGKLVGLAARYNVMLMVDFNHRFRYGFSKLLELVRKDALGEIVSVVFFRSSMLGQNAGNRNDTWRRTPGMVCGMTVESLSHDIDMIMQLAGGIADVKADVRGTLGDVPEFDTNATASFTMKSGAMAMIQASWSSHIKSCSRGVIGTKGTAVLEGDDLFDFTRLRLKTDDMEFENRLILNDIYDIATCESYVDANRHFIDCIVSGKPSAVSGEYALETLAVSRAILEAARTQVVVSPESMMEGARI